MTDLAATFAGIAQSVSAQFGGPYVSGAVIGSTPPVLDTGGSIVTPGTPTERPCQIQIDVASESMRQSDGYADGDVRFLILAATLEGALDTDARVRVDGGPNVGLWMVSAIERDALGVYWSGRGRRG